MNASIAIQVLPKVATNEETIRIVDEVIDYIKSFDVKFEVGPFETTVEGDYDTLMEIVKGCPKICTNEGAPSVMTYVKINFAPSGVLTIDEKCEKYREKTVCDLKPLDLEAIENYVVCKCNNVSSFDILEALQNHSSIENLLDVFEDVKNTTHCSTGCGGCYEKVVAIISEALSTGKQ